MIALDGVEHVIEAGTVIDIQPYTRHGFQCLGDEPLRIMEISTQHFEYDTIREALPWAPGHEIPVDVE
jgi:mannose-6-phosphate isomerase-like protein (cupin superfamily)